MAKQKTDWVVVATSGPTIDGREIDPKWLTDAAEVYNPDEHTAMLWPYHAPADQLIFTNNYGLVDALKAEKVGDKVQLKAHLIPNRFLLEANKAGQKLFTSIDVRENYLGTGRFYVHGIVVTDTPASINTTRLQFSQGEAPHMGNVEELNFTLQSDNEQAKRGFFSRFFSSAPHKQENDNSMNEKQFNQLMDAINQTSERLDKMEEKVAQFSEQKEPENADNNTPESNTTDNSDKGTKTFTLTTEQGEKLFSTINAIAGKVDKMEAAFTELTQDATQLPGNNPAGGETFNLV
ncbi:GPO family capsid scaffolding protein [Yersinia enterocolitica]|uniref:GPO family capsid scaffolding protein n=1 Tax=Yersinia enterocolitica TaxID=630 RepID=UPI001C609BE2|nr:GPO family capsid scaffolding protein [Yersinia enterocolitica]MBW5870297.1 GPO family capsid scaffolding protein [Yersinia enterocolitica]MBW5879184.1 GPO family capsid scaffolding protein [Yersinia enterocolitica]MBX9477283.1 GPO family capsid scaffolding protein [Yersinia enterocolitica]